MCCGGGRRGRAGSDDHPPLGTQRAGSSSDACVCVRERKELIVACGGVAVVSQVEENFNVPLMGVDKAVLEKVVDFLKLYHNDPMRKIEKVGVDKGQGQAEGWGG